jgi:hypothetical protein
MLLKCSIYRQNYSKFLYKIFTKSKKLAPIFCKNHIATIRTSQHLEGGGVGEREADVLDAGGGHVAQRRRQEDQRVETGADLMNPFWPVNYGQHFIVLKYNWKIWLFNLRNGSKMIKYSN